MLDQLQKDSEAALWGETTAGSVIAATFNKLCICSDEEIKRSLIFSSIELLPIASPEFKNAKG